MRLFFHAMLRGSICRKMELSTGADLRGTPIVSPHVSPHISPLLAKKNKNSREAGLVATFSSLQKNAGCSRCFSLAHIFQTQLSRLPTVLSPQAALALRPPQGFCFAHCDERKINNFTEKLTSTLVSTSMFHIFLPNTSKASSLPFTQICQRGLEKPKILPKRPTSRLARLKIEIILDKTEKQNEVQLFLPT